MTLLHSVLFPLRLVWARLSGWSGPVVLVVLGIAAGAAVVVGGRAGAQPSLIAFAGLSRQIRGGGVAVRHKSGGPA